MLRQQLSRLLFTKTLKMALSPAPERWAGPPPPFHPFEFITRALRSGPRPWGPGLWARDLGSRARGPGPGSGARCPVPGAGISGPGVRDHQGWAAGGTAMQWQCGGGRGEIMYVPSTALNALGDTPPAKLHRLLICSISMKYQIFLKM